MKIFSRLFTLVLLFAMPQFCGAQATVTIEPTNQSVTLGGTAYFNAIISSNGYCGGQFVGQWLFNGTNIPSIITTVAGNGIYGYSGDGGPGTNAELSDPNSSAFDAFGNLYIGDGGNNVIRKLDTNGIITTVAGGGTGGGTDTYGDGGPATNAIFNNVLFVSFDPSGNYYIVDQYHELVRKVNTNGIITVFAGGGGGSGGSDGIGDDGPATNAIFNNPTSVTFDHLGNAYISDNGDSLVRKVDTNGIITVFAGNYSLGWGYDGDGGPATNAQISNPNGLAIDTLGNLYISDSENNVIRMVDTNGYISTVAGDYYSGWSWTGDGGPATSAGLNFPNDIWVDGFGNIYIADNLNSLVREVNRATGIITTIAGNGTRGYSGDGGAPTNAEISAGGVAVNTFGDLYIFGSGNSTVRKVSNVLMQDGFLAIPNVTGYEGGAYQAIVTSPCGSITSSVATLTVMDTNGLSCNWELEYFGQTGLDPNSDPDGDGNNLLYDYENNIDPNVIQFSISVTNQYVNTLAPIQLSVIAGEPFYYAVMVDNTNFSEASWNAYTSSNIIANLGSLQGWHTVFVGLKGLPANANQTWQWTRLFITSPPLMVITSPSIPTVDMPVIQIYGYCQESLASISYDLSNSAGIFTNQPSEITDQFFDTNAFGITTNYFECLDVSLTNGLNTITMHATDLAGNITTTNFNFTVDYSSKTNPPVVQITWPQDGTQISGTNFTCSGSISDPTATIVASTTFTNTLLGGFSTNSYSAEMGRDGSFSLENIPLNTGTNLFTITVTDVVGNTAVTNINIVQTNFVLTINPVSPDSQLWQPTVNLTGGISDPTYAVWVNGVKGTNNGNGTWSAGNVPVNNANFAATAYAPNEQQPDGSYGN